LLWWAGYLIPFPFRDQVRSYSICHRFCSAPNFRIIQHLNRDRKSVV
jgi:hypothetical protein